MWPKHYFAPKAEVRDTCRYCGLNFRNEAHCRIGEDPEIWSIDGQPFHYKITKRALEELINPAKDLLLQVVRRWVEERTPRDDTERMLLAAWANAYPDEVATYEKCECRRSREFSGCDECQTQAHVDGQIAWMKEKMRVYGH